MIHGCLIHFISFAGPKEIDEVPPLPRREFAPEGRHAAEAEGYSPEDGGVGQALYKLLTESGRWRRQNFADRPGLRRGPAMTHGAIDGKKLFSLRQGFRG